LAFFKDKFGYVEFCVNICTVNDKKKIKTDRYESVKIKKEVVALVRDNKKITGIAIGFFFESLALKELKKKDE